MSKPKTILRQIFEGELYPAENLSGGESRELSKAITAEREYISGLLTEDDKTRLEKMEALHHELSTDFGGECFACGFRLGAMLLIEVFSKDIGDPEQSGE